MHTASALAAASPDADAFDPPIERYLRELHQRYRDCREGRVADYIPELAKASPDCFGIAIATRDGHVYEVGDSRQAFTIQSISKALVYGLALEDRGEDHVLSRVGVEPSGEAFNAISLKPGSGVPFNPMINAGAIATTGQVISRDGKIRIERIVDYLSACAGRRLDIDPLVYRSESDTGHRNRAIGWMLRNFDILAEEPTDALETYFQQCSIRVSCRDLAIMGATLANYGVNPVSGQRAVAAEGVDNILSVMATCGMYDFSGEWLYRVGLPAKSGVGGGILAVLPGQLGIGIFSPPLDAQGNSLRGIRVCNDLSRDMALHLFHNGAGPQPALRLSYDATQVGSRRRRPPAQRDALRREGGRVRVLELQGELIFSTLEPVLRAVGQQVGECEHFVLNLGGVSSADAVSLGLLVQLQRALAEQGARLAACHAAPYAARLTAAGFAPELIFPDDDLALEDCENRLLAALPGVEESVPESLPLARCELLEGLPGEDIAWLDSVLETRSYAGGEAILRAGDPGGALYLLVSGSVEVRLPGEAGRPGRRIDVYTAGMSFGEMGYVDGSPRSAHVLALEPVRCRVIDQEVSDRFYPKLRIRLLQRLTRLLSTNLRRVNRELAAYRG